MSDQPRDTSSNFERGMPTMAQAEARGKAAAYKHCAEYCREYLGPMRGAEMLKWCEQQAQQAEQAEQG